MAKYKTELEARQAYVLECLKWCGIKEGSKDHQSLIEFYNLIDPLPRGVRMTVTMAWCAAYLAAVAWKLGYRNWYLECSCSRLMSQAKAEGRWRDRNYVPQVGDWCVYDLDKNKAVDHIGVVTGVEGRRVFVCEGNYSDSVKNRFDVEVGDEIVYGYIVNDFYELVDNSNWVGADRPNIPIEIPEIKEDETMKTYKTVDEMPDWAKKEMQSLQDSGAMKGRGGEEGLDLTESEVRFLTIMTRYVGYVHGLEPDAPEIHDDLVQIGGGEIIRPVEPPEPEPTI